jgi:hypothetical protein
MYHCKRLLWQIIVGDKDMKSKKKLWWLVLPIGIALLCFGFISCLNIIAPPQYDEYPKKSTKNEFMLFNDGCCLVLKDFSIWLTNESGLEYPLFSHDLPPYGKRLAANLPQNVSGSVQVIVSFYYDYVTSGHVKFQVLEFENFETLKENGLLLIFGDGDLSVQSGTLQAFYYYNKTPWADNLSVSKYSEATGKHYEKPSHYYLL